MSKVRICRMFGITRQAYYKRQKAMVASFLKEQVIVSAVRGIRQSQPRVGGRKLQRMLQKLAFQIGRDKLFAILRKYRLLIKPGKNYRKTTDSYHRFKKYPNIIKEREISHSNAVFVADITYLHTLEGFCYLSLITDVYSRKIVGWNVSQSLATTGCKKALSMALKNVQDSDTLIHHSDRGIQYCSNAYVKILNRNDIAISMTEEKHVYENAIAERVNGILKSEFFLGEKLQSRRLARQLAADSIKIYNEQRLHTSLDYQTPAQRYEEGKVIHISTKEKEKSSKKEKENYYY